MVRVLMKAMAVVLAGVAVLSACAGPERADPAPRSAAPGKAAPAPVAAVGGELVLRLARDPDTFNPILTFTAYGSAVANQVFATLFEFNEKWEPTPYVAESWTPSADGLAWTIKIRDGIKFHDGTDLTAEDVAFTISSIMDKGYKGPRKASVTPIKRVTAPDKLTLVVELHHPFAPLLQHINYGILPRRLFQGTAVADMGKHEASANRPVGAGPYRFVEYRRGQHVLLERNAAWFMSKERGGAPYIQTLRYRVIADDQAALADLEAGRLDMDTPDPKEVDRLSKLPKLQAFQYERNGWGYVIINTSRPPLENPQVRQALTLGLDRPTIIKGALGGRAVIPPGPIPPVSWAYDPTMKPAGYDPSMAKQLLEKAGYKLGKTGLYELAGRPIRLVMHVSAGAPLIENIAAIAKRNWKEIGIDLDVQVMDFNALAENVLRPGKFDLSIAGYGLGFDPDPYELFHSSQGAANTRNPVVGANLMRYRNPRVDELLEAGRREADPARRKALYAEFQRLVADDAPVILLYTNTYTDFVSDKVKGGIVNMPGTGATGISRWWIQQAP